ncbi:hypothetical protein KL1_00029 [Burkholderia phage vB_BceS_KL1]|uniref:DUF3310 domain-containing protein n=1 Tax=Burkholderia phage vB_BceS_KL1 TaxID=1132026 RepID=I6NM99_9CAUD|nr:hypothetical protein B612_gp42 [Burkholderia phage vB_BceS_KL1]AEX56077.1 hypothetical protein KL1_00029 [Burkholderia phage vB_BceS_KL1]
MCKCTPNIRTPYCGKSGCEWPGKKPDNARTLSVRGNDWQAFSAEVLAHIETYTVPQYGDKGEDIASDYSAQDCINGAKKYLARFGRNSRPGQDKLDLLKAAHYLQMAAMNLDEQGVKNDNAN